MHPRLTLSQIVQAREQETVSDLLVRLPSKGAYSADDLRAGLGKVTEQLDDIMCDCAWPLVSACLHTLPPGSVDHTLADVWTMHSSPCHGLLPPCCDLKQTSRRCRMDAPLAPKLCAGVLGRALLQGVLPPDAIPELCKPIEGGEVRRALVAPALQYVKVSERSKGPSSSRR
jgi:hypothetical protein